jgi:hypothetical protein
VILVTIDTVKDVRNFNPLNAELNPLRPLQAILGAPHILHVSRTRVKAVNENFPVLSTFPPPPPIWINLCTPDFR